MSKYLHDHLSKVAKQISKLLLNYNLDSFTPFVNKRFHFWSNDIVSVFYKGW